MFEGYGEYNRHLDPDQQRDVTDADVEERALEIWQDSAKLGALFSDELARFTDAQTGVIVAELYDDPLCAALALQAILRERVERQARKELTK